MAITITQEPLGIYPGYNNSIMKFTSDLANNNRAEITADPIATFPKKFVIYPDLDGVYTFNIKDIIKVKFNESGFFDANVFIDAYYKSISGLFKTQNLLIEIFSDIDSEFTDETYSFLKAVKQIGETIFFNDYQLLSNTRDGINHALTYFEGFPFHVDILKATTADAITVKSLNSGISTEIMTATATDSFRINIDKGGADNWTSDNYLPLITGLNRLEIYKNTIFASNLILNKKKICGGIYLKWFNSNGGFSFFLFEQFYNEVFKTADAGEISSNDFLNIEDKIRNKFSTGKNTEKTLVVKAKISGEEYDTVKTIFSSPLIQMYTSQEAYVEGKFIDVDVNGNFTHNNKRANNQIILNIELPEIITAKL